MMGLYAGLGASLLLALLFGRADRRGNRRQVSDLDRLPDSATAERQSRWAGKPAAVGNDLGGDFVDRPTMTAGDAVDHPERGI